MIEPQIAALRRPVWSRKARDHVVVIVGVILLLGVVGIVANLTFGHPAPLIEETDFTKGLMDCTSSYASKINVDRTDYNTLSASLALCQSILATGLLAREQAARDETYVFQRSENVVLMWMVVVITVSGVLLAGLQLFASYRLALQGRVEFAKDNEFSLKRDSIVIKSSVVGLIILAISFAFFMVFVLYVYTLREAEPLHNVSPQHASAAPAAPPGNIGRSIEPSYRTGTPPPLAAPPPLPSTSEPPRQ
jgi:hypothetical protein